MGTKTAIVSVDGHVKASRAQFRDYVEKRHLETYDEQVRAADEAGLRDAGNLHPEFAPEVQWDSDLRIRNLESIAVVAEVLFPNGRPFQVNRLDDFARAESPELTEAGRWAYNRWLVDFCSQAPERRRGQMQMNFSDVDQAVDDVYWAKENGLGGIALPGMNPGDRFFFDPELDPIWAACQEVGLPITQHGGAGLPAYSPAGFPSLMTVMIENAFFSARSIWMLLVGGVFDRFPELRCAWIETQVMFLLPAIAQLERVLDPENDWMSFARMMGREHTVQRLPTEYFGTNIFVGVSPFSPLQVSIPDLVGKDADQNRLPGVHIGVDATMFGVDYPHYESIYQRSLGEVALLARTPGVTEQDVHRICFENAARFYGFDANALQPYVDAVGFEVDDVLAGADELIKDMPRGEVEAAGTFRSVG